MIGWNNLQGLLTGYREKTKLSAKTGISTGNISDWFNPDKNAQPSADALIKIADYFGCSVDYLLDRTNMKEFVRTPTSVTQIPIFSQKAAAGFGKESVEDVLEPPEMKWFYEDQVPQGAKYGVMIEGDSMEPKFYDGQTVFVKLVNDCPDGSYGIFTITDSDETKVYFKQKHMKPDGSYVLHSLNEKKYKDI